MLSDGIKILVIDDEPDICELIQLCLEEFAGWDVTCAGSGNEGLAAIESSSFDAILLDISMPQVDGLLVYKELKQREETKMTPVIFITARVLPSEQKIFTEMGVAGIVSKPFNPVSLWQEIAKMLGWRIP